MTTTRFDVPEISCETCQNALEVLVGPLAGVRQATVDVAGKTVTVAHEPDVVGTGRLVEVIEDQGYDVQGVTEVS